MVKLFVILTAADEAATVGRAVEQIVCPNKELWPYLQLLIVSPDQPTLEAAEKVCQAIGFADYTLVADAGRGKAAALNLAVATITNTFSVNYGEDLLIMTDGDMYVADHALQELLASFCIQPGNPQSDSQGGRLLGGVGGHPVSLTDRQTRFGYYSHLFCEAAHQRRLTHPATPMSGYLYAVRLLKDFFPIPEPLNAEDAYISKKLLSLGYQLGYAPEALAYVRFPQNLSDWYKQKTRSLGGNVQIGKIDQTGQPIRPLIRETAGRPSVRSVRSPGQDLQMLLFPVKFAQNAKELIWSLQLYPLRLLLWVKIYYRHLFKSYPAGQWARIESSKH
ncbi:glycosyltransferase family 2 protein [Patescibacteria group bacterium]|nr:glycosyltransferase family 2 protein [Patescibacteria group bacterium]MBU1970592.1 glycosyltransferase family 2 protein [Patescibacteria group bacterium]